MATTGFFSHPDCLLHEMGAMHPESPHRLTAIEKEISKSDLQKSLVRFEAPEASIDDLALAHDRLYLAALRGLHDTLVEQIAAGGSPHIYVDSDTLMNAHSWQAILRSAGAAIAATDAVIAGEIRNAFCATRPAGHHACRSKAMGFCFVNNVAVAAKYALERHGLSRVAIIDFDVHHGNGTEDIVAGDERIMMASFYQHPFYPQGGARSNAPNLVNVPVEAYTDGKAIQAMVQSQWLPRLDAHRPEMLFISAGFDAHQEDRLGQMGLVEKDFTWLTQTLCDVANRHANSRIVSCLEGGYSLNSLTRSVAAHLKVLTHQPARS